MLNSRLGTEADFKQLEQEVGEAVARAVRFADESPFPERPSLYEDVYVE